MRKVYQLICLRQLFMSLNLWYSRPFLQCQKIKNKEFV